MNQYVCAESAKLVFSGEDYFETLLQIIDEAQEIIHIQTYIFESDETGRKVTNALVNAYKRGVSIFVLADAFGSKSLSKDFILQLNSEGINFRLFSPLFSSESIYLGRRLHHKVVVVDKKIALIGGINISDKYHGTANEPAWLDFSVLIKGESCIFLHHLCSQIFEKKNFKIRSERENEKHLSVEKIKIRFRRNDWIRNKNEIHKSFRDALKNADKSVVIVASYFLPGFFFRKILEQTRKRGVGIKIILAGKSDLRVFKYAEQYLYRFLFSNGIKIYEWRNSVMHGKAILTDNEWTSIGSYNLNYLSHYRSIELNVDIMDEKFSTSFENHLMENVFNKSTEITTRNFFQLNGTFSRIRNYIAYYYLKIAMKFLMPKK